MAGARLFEPGYQQECGFDGRNFTVSAEAFDGRPVVAVRPS
jgi:hypothetical protein